MTLEQVNELKRRADSDGSYNLRCRHCGEKVVFLEGREALAKGHIYSQAGRREYSITTMCEWCFDEVTLPYEEEEDGA